VLGTFALYRQEPSVPSPRHLALIGFASRLAAIAIERNRAMRALQREKEERERLLEERETALAICRWLHTSSRTRWARFGCAPSSCAGGCAAGLDLSAWSSNT
jgi:GAF domain-containing protein